MVNKIKETALKVWNIINGKDADMDKQYTTEGRTMRFLRQLVIQATSAKTESFEKDLNAAGYEFMTMYDYTNPEVFYQPEGDHEMEDHGEGHDGEEKDGSRMEIFME